jgi:hypothetical protein
MNIISGSLLAWIALFPFTCFGQSINPVIDDYSEIFIDSAHLRCGSSLLQTVTSRRGKAIVSNKKQLQSAKVNKTVLVDPALLSVNTTAIKEAFPPWVTDVAFAIFSLVLIVFGAVCVTLLFFGSKSFDYEPQTSKWSTLPEDDVASTMREFKLEPNVFGSFTLMCAKEYKDIDRVQAIWSLMLVLTALFVQACFSCVMIPYIAMDAYKNKYQVTPNGGFDNLFEEWRAHPHGPDWGASSAEMAAWSCHGQLWTWEESMISNYMHYNTFIKILGRPTFMTKGQMFGIIAMFLWAADVLAAMRSWATYIMLLFPGLVHNSKPQNLSPFLKKATWVIAACRFIVLTNICHAGLKFLAITDNLKDFILNSVALGFVIDIHDLLYIAFASNVEKEELDRFKKEGNLSVRVPNMVWKASGIVSVVIGFLMVLIGVWYLWNFSQHLNYDVFQKLCEGVMPEKTTNYTVSAGSFRSPRQIISR